MEDKEEMHDFSMVEVTTAVSDDGFVEVNLPANFKSNGSIVTKGAFTLLGQKKNSEGEEEGHSH